MLSLKEIKVTVAVGFFETGDFCMKYSSLMNDESSPQRWVNRIPTPNEGVSLFKHCEVTAEGGTFHICTKNAVCFAESSESQVYLFSHLP